MKWIRNIGKMTSIRCAHFFCVFVSSFLILVQSLDADVKLPEGLGPVATPITVNVNRGEDILIKLTASMKGSGGVFDFSIFEKPKNGQLVTQSLTGAFALVRYISDPRSSSSAEEFKFRARIPNGRYSAPATVRINVLDDPLRLKIPEVLDFGEVVVGQGRTLELLVSNISKYSFKGSLFLPKEFSLEGKKDKFELGPEESAKFRVKYAPEEVIGSFQRKLFLKGAGVSSSSLLRGSSVSPFKIKSKKILLEYSNENFTRAAEIQIENVSGTEIDLEVTEVKGDFIVQPKTILIGEGESKRLMIVAVSDNPSGSIGSVSLSSRFDSQKIEIESPPLPHRVIVNGGENTIKIGSVQGVPLRFKFGVENVGGGNIGVSVTVPGGFRRINGEGDIELGPNESQILQIEYDSKKEGSIYDYIDLRWNDNVQRIIVKGNVSVESGNEIVSKKSNASSPKSPKVKGEDNLFDYLLLKRIEKDREFDYKLPKVEEIKLIGKGKDSLILGWPVPKSDDKSLAGMNLRYVVETRVHRYDKEKKSMMLEWLELDEQYVILTKNGSKVEAEVRGLSSDGKFTFRVFSQSENGSVSAASIPFQFSTKSSFKFTRASWIYLIGVGGALLGISCFLVQRKINHSS